MADVHEELRWSDTREDEISGDLCALAKVVVVGEERRTEIFELAGPRISQRASTVL